jgi:HPt (histidine-containing phosphotransfer) domain-containing protein
MDSDGSVNNRPIDVAVLLDRCMDDAGLALKVLRVFEEQTSETLKGLERCAKLGAGGASVEEAARRAHALRGSAGAIGANILFEVATRLEEAAHAGTVEAAERLALEVVAELRRCVACMPSVKTELAPRTGQG